MLSLRSKIYLAISVCKSDHVSRGQWPKKEVTLLYNSSQIYVATATLRVTTVIVLLLVFWLYNSDFTM